MWAYCTINKDYRGHFSHGINRLEMYFNDVRVGATSSGGQPVILNEKVSIFGDKLYVVYCFQ